MATSSQFPINFENCIFSEIGHSSNTTVYKIENPEQKNSNYALKSVFHNTKQSKNHCESECEDLKNEYFLLKNINHPNIIQVMQLFENSPFFFEQNKKQQGCQMLMELALFDGIELLNFTGIKKQNLNLNSVQNIFSQICKGVQYLHEKDITHNDLKLDNILVFQEDVENHQFHVKIADFGHATRDHKKFTYQEQGIKFKQKIQEYMSPELLLLQAQFQENQFQQQQVIDEKKSDIFSLGVSLFMAVMWKHPFRHIASEHDKIFQYMYKRQYNHFWSSFQKIMIRVQKNNKSQTIEHFQDLVQSMLSYEPEQRPNIDQVLKHPFFKQI